MNEANPRRRVTAWLRGVSGIQDNLNVSCVANGLIHRSGQFDAWDSTNPYEWRRRWRQRLPRFLIDLGIAAKGKDCEAVGAKHLWYNHDNENSDCYYCEVRRPGRLWEGNAD